MTFMLNISGRPVDELVISMVVSGGLICIGCYGLSLFFKRAGGDEAKNLVWGLLVGAMLGYLLTLVGLGDLNIVVLLAMLGLMIYIFIALRDPLRIIGHTGWSRLWLFVPIVNIIAPYLWAREVKESEERSETIDTETIEAENVARDLNALAGLYRDQGKYSEAERLYNRALKMREEAFGPEHPDVATVCENMAELYRQIGKEDEAERLEERARRIRSNQ